MITRKCQLTLVRFDVETNTLVLEHAPYQKQIKVYCFFEYETYENSYTQAALKFPKPNTKSQQREAVVRRRSLLLIRVWV
ncbi:MAG: hypothetical protein LBJ00_03655 [Planctomycetaceae bacterium]|nr:hypothetical protein [Planctomycetaceae bacterium]